MCRGADVQRWYRGGDAELQVAEVQRWCAEFLHLAVLQRWCRGAVVQRWCRDGGTEEVVQRWCSGGPDEVLVQRVLWFNGAQVQRCTEVVQ